MDARSRSYDWYFEGRRWTATFSFDERMLERVRRLPHDIYGVANYRRYVFEDPYLLPVVHWMGDVFGRIPTGRARESMLNRALRFSLAFVQHIPYASDRGDEYPRYPSEMMMDGCGDCEDSAILFAAFALALGYECAFLRFGGNGFLGFGGWGHLDVGVVPRFDREFEGAFWDHEGRRYFYCSCNGQGLPIGELGEDEYRLDRIHPIRR